MKTELFQYPFEYANVSDIGKKRSDNQDRIICCPKYGFFAISDGMGGLIYGGDTADILVRVLPDMIGECFKKVQMRDLSPEQAGQLLANTVEKISDAIFDTTHRSGAIEFGATLSGVWLLRDFAVFINMGDSRGYLLPRYARKMLRITQDHNVAQIFLQKGKLNEEEARANHRAKKLTRFVGMNSPAKADIFVCKLSEGAKILLCSDGLYREIEEERIPKILRSSGSLSSSCKRLVGEANQSGGSDNISALCLKIGSLS